MPLCPAPVPAPDSLLSSTLPPAAGVDPTPDETFDGWALPRFNAHRTRTPETLRDNPCSGRTARVGRLQICKRVGPDPSEGQWPVGYRM